MNRKFKVWLDWGDGFVPLHDFNGRDLIRQDSFRKSQTLHNNLDPVKDQATFIIDWVTSVANSLFTIEPFIEVEEDGDITRKPNITTVQIVEERDGTDFGWFYGYARPVTEFSIGEDRVIEMEALDNSWRLERSASGDLATDLLNETVYDIIDAILKEAGYSEDERSDIPEELKDIILPRFPARRGDNLQEILTDFLYCYGYVYYFDEIGHFRAYPWIADSITTTDRIDNTNIIDEIKATRDDDRAGFDLDPENGSEKLEITIYGRVPRDNVLVASSSYNDLTVPQDGRTFSPHWDIVDTFEGDIVLDRSFNRLRVSYESFQTDGWWIFNSSSWEEYTRTFRNPGDSSRNLELTSIDPISFNNAGNSIRTRTTFRQQDNDGMRMQKIDVYADLVTHSPKDTITVELPFRARSIKDEYITKKEVAERLETALIDRYKISVYEYEVKSEEFFELGQYLNLVSQDLNIDTAVRVVEREEVYDDGVTTFDYKLEQVSELSQVFNIISEPVQRSEISEADIREATQRTKRGFDEGGNVSKPILGYNLQEITFDNDGLPADFRPSETGLVMMSNFMGFYDYDNDDFPVRIWNDDGTGKFFAGETFSGSAGQEFIEWDGTRLLIQGDLQSANFTEGLEGWRILNDGDAEFNDVVVRGTVEADAGFIGGWRILEFLESEEGPRKIRLDPARNRISIFADGVETVAMGYLNNLQRINEPDERYGPNERGFWALPGDRLSFFGEMSYEEASLMIQEDSVIRINNAQGNPALWLGSFTGERGLYFLDGQGTNRTNLRAALTPNRLSYPFAEGEFQSVATQSVSSFAAKFYGGGGITAEMKNISGGLEVEDDMTATITGDFALDGEGVPDGSLDISAGEGSDITYRTTGGKHKFQGNVEFEGDLQLSGKDYLPIGTILMYDGTNWVDNETLKGWYACIPENANKGCPNLVDSFIQGKDISSSPSTGGSNSKTLSVSELPSHRHSASLSGSTNTTGSHNHGYQRPVGNQNAEDGFGQTVWRNGDGTTDSAGNHSHSVSVSGNTDNTGGGNSWDNRPSYYTLIYIRKCE